VLLRRELNAGDAEIHELGLQLLDQRLAELKQEDKLEDLPTLDEAVRSGPRPKQGRRGRGAQRPLQSRRVRMPFQ
jgi:hypothetical protein